MRLGALAAALLLPALGWGMSMGKFSLFSAVEGTVVNHGQPVADATIERSYHWVWKDQKGTDRASTDAQGHFRMPAIEGSSLLGAFLPHEPIVRQTLTIHHGGREYEAWVLDKRNYKDNGELDGKPIRLRCDLANEDKESGEVYGICRIE